MKPERTYVVRVYAVDSIYTDPEEHRIVEKDDDDPILKALRKGVDGVFQNIGYVPESKDKK